MPTSIRVRDRRTAVTRHIDRRLAVLGVGLLLVLIQASTAFALVPAYRVEDLTALSTDVVIGTVTDRISEWQDWPYGGRVIMTTYTVLVVDRLKGDAPAAVSVVVPGGKVGDTTILASDCPDLEVGSELALFLKKDVKGLPRYWIFGLERGTFEIAGAEARPFAHDAAVIPLDNLKRRVARVVEDGR